MTRIVTTALLIFATLIISACCHDCRNPPADIGPSDEAKDMPGSIGRIIFRPNDWNPSQGQSWWVDSDGVKPEVAGCHEGVVGENDPTRNGRYFGEACLSEVVLVESNPGKDDIHAHKDDIGKPDIFHCNAWCVGNGKAGGSCQVVKVADDKSISPCDISARCSCN